MIFHIIETLEQIVSHVSITDLSLLDNAKSCFKKKEKENKKHDKSSPRHIMEKIREEYKKKKKEVDEEKKETPNLNFENLNDQKYLKLTMQEKIQEYLGCLGVKEEITEI